MTRGEAEHGFLRERVDAGWLAALREGTVRPPLRPRVPLICEAGVIGSVEPDFLRPVAGLARLAGPDGAALLRPSDAGWRLHGSPAESLARVAAALRDAGLAHAWRDEQLAVHDASGTRVATVERAVVRVLGIETRAVHLVGRSPDGRVWLQQRAFTKANDPGLWDTLMGGMVSAADTLEQALHRETWEEAGLVVGQLTGVAWGGRITIRRPSDDGGGAGYVIEAIDWFRAVVPESTAPVNQDGEVERFELASVDALAPRLARGEFTAEAALILCDAL